MIISWVGIDRPVYYFFMQALPSSIITTNRFVNSRVYFINYDIFQSIDLNNSCLALPHDGRVRALLLAGRLKQSLQSADRSH